MSHSWPDPKVGNLVVAYYCSMVYNTEFVLLLSSKLPIVMYNLTKCIESNKRKTHQKRVKNYNPRLFFFSWNPLVVFPLTFACKYSQLQPEVWLMAKTLCVFSALKKLILLLGINTMATVKWIKWCECQYKSDIFCRTCTECCLCVE